MRWPAVRRPAMRGLVVRAVPADGLSFAGLAVLGPRNAVDKVFKGATLHP